LRIPHGRGNKAKTESNETLMRIRKES
jgi:hypothetical protein